MLSSTLEPGWFFSRRACCTSLYTEGKANALAAIKAAEDHVSMLLVTSRDQLEARAVQADCQYIIVYLCVPVCVIEGGGASSTVGLKAPPGLFFFLSI